MLPKRWKASRSFWHAKNPEYFPMAMPDDNAGEWTDQFTAFRDAIEGTKDEMEVYTPNDK
jgi:hypothetical protein